MIELPLTTVGLFCAAVGFAVVANLVFYAMIGQVNRKLGENEQISFFGFDPGILFKVHRAHKGFYPKSSLRLWLHALGTLAVAFWLASFWSFGLLP